MKKACWLGFVVILALLALALPVLAAGDGVGGIVGGEALALLMAGFVAPYLAQFLKRAFGGLEALPALWVSFGTSVVVALVALFITGELGWTSPPAEPVALLTWFSTIAGSVFALATMVYKLKIKPPMPEISE